MGVDVSQGFVDLLVVGELASAEGLDDAIEAHLAINIGGLGCSIGSMGNLDWKSGVWRVNGRDGWKVWGGALTEFLPGWAEISEVAFVRDIVVYVNCVFNY